MSIYTTTYLNSMSSLGFLTDRNIENDVELPHSFRDIKVKPNTLLTSTSFNKSIELLNENFLYLISQGKIPTTNIPINNTHYLSGYGDNIDSYQYIPNRCKINEIQIQNAIASIPDTQPFKVVRKLI